MWAEVGHNPLPALTGRLDASEWPCHSHLANGKTAPPSWVRGEVDGGRVTGCGDRCSPLGKMVD